MCQQFGCVNDISAGLQHSNCVFKKIRPHNGATFHLFIRRDKAIWIGTFLVKTSVNSCQFLVFYNPCVLTKLTYHNIKLLHRHRCSSIKRNNRNNLIIVSSKKISLWCLSYFTIRLTHNQHSYLFKLNVIIWFHDFLRPHGLPAWSCSYFCLYWQLHILAVRQLPITWLLFMNWIRFLCAMSRWQAWLNFYLKWLDHVAV